MSNQTVRVRKLRTFVLSAQAAPSYIIMKFTANMKRRVDGLAVLIVDRADSVAAGVAACWLMSSLLTCCGQPGRLAYGRIIIN